MLHMICADNDDPSDPSDEIYYLFYLAVKHSALDWCCYSIYIYITNDIFMLFFLYGSFQLLYHCFFPE